MFVMFLLISVTENATSGHSRVEFLVITPDITCFHVSSTLYIWLLILRAHISDIIIINVHSCITYEKGTQSYHADLVFINSA